MSFKRSAAFGAAFVVIVNASPARPADLAPVLPPVPPYGWTGFYVGGNLGIGRANVTSDALIGGTIVASAAEDLAGAVGGVQAGHNWQVGNIVFGVEADIQASGQSASWNIGGITGADSIPWFGTVRGRVGVAADRYLVYATGGFAYGEFRSEANIAGTTIGVSENRGAWTVGAGVEAALWGNWSGKAEYLFIDTGNIDATVGTVTLRSRVQDHVGRVGVNYRF